MTICSTRIGYLYFKADPNTLTAASCTPGNDGGGPGDRVWVTVDFDHPLIVPILSNWFPVLHLTAKREGIVEQFRVARVVGLPATISIPTFTATSSPTLTITPTPTITPTITETPTTTLTVTPTATLDCSLITASDVDTDVGSGTASFYFHVNNNTSRTIYLTSGTLDWYDYYTPFQRFNAAYFGSSWYINFVGDADTAQ